MRTVVAEDDVTRPIVPVKITNASTGRSTVVLGMIDSGADRDVLSLQIVKKLDLPTEKMLMRVHTVNCEVVEEKVLASFIAEGQSKIWVKKNVGEGLSTVLYP